MVFEAVPCMISGGQTPQGVKCFGYIIRTTAQDGTEAGPSTSSAASAVRVVSTGQPVSIMTTLSNGNAVAQPLQGVISNGGIMVGEKILVPAGMMRLTAAPTTTVEAGPSNSTPQVNNGWQNGNKRLPSVATFASPASISTPSPSQPRSMSVCSSSSLNETSPMSPVPIPMQRYLHGNKGQVMSSGSNGTTSWVVTTTQCPMGPSGVQTTNSDSSTTPDSGIQSVPTSPPNNLPLTPPTMEACDSVCEGGDFEDYADMPRLLPADQEEEEDITMSSMPPPLANREDGASHGSECETAAMPSISISPSMDSDEIVNRLLALDPEKASAIASLIKKKTTQQRKRKNGSTEKAAENGVASSKKRSRPSRAKNNAKGDVLEEPQQAPEEAVVVFEEHVEDEQRPQSSAKADNPQKGPKEVKAVVEEVVNKKEEEDYEEEDPQVRYRLAVQRNLELAVEREITLCMSEIESLKLGHDRKPRKNSAKTWLHELEVLHKKIKESMKSKKAKEKTSTKVTKESEKKKKETTKGKKGQKKAEKEAKTETAPRRQSTSSTRRRVSESTNDDVIAKFNGEYEEIPRSVAHNNFIKGWEAPSLQCGCTRGACTSDVECSNRALRVQCTVACAASLCANKKFWKEDTSRVTISSGPKSKRVLRTKQAKRAGEFVCEFAGEVISFSEARARCADEADPKLILSINSLLFVDANKKSNAARFIRHSCRPNSRLEVWSVNGRYRAGIFSLFDIASGAEITIDKDGLLALDQTCNCGFAECKKVLRPARYAIVASGEDLDKSERDFVKESGLFLLRNRRSTIAAARRVGLPTSLVTASTSQANVATSLGRLLDAVAYRVRRIDGSLPLSSMRGYSALHDVVHDVHRGDVGGAEAVEMFGSLMKEWLEVVDDDDIDRAYMALRGKLLDVEKATAVDDKKTPSKKTTSATSSAMTTGSRVLSKHTDLSYLDSEWPIGSYDPDSAWPKDKANEADNAVRCVCGSLDEDGEMLQCDGCHFWLHMDCVGDIDLDQDYKCQLCCGAITSGRPTCDVKLRTQPRVRFDQCTYYKALMNRRDIQVRLNETVFVKKVIGDEHKKVLRELMEIDDKKKSKKDEKKGKDKQKVTAETSPMAAEMFDRKEARIFRVERLFAGPGGHRFVFGFYYAWPHETFCDSQRIFNPQEVFASPFYDTLPLDAVIGRCIVLDPNVWTKGRPTVPDFKEMDVYVCEYQIDRNQRSFEKISAKNRYPINTQPYVFRNFSSPLQLKRDFTPFVASDRNSTTPRASSKMSTTSVDSEGRRRDGRAKQATRNLQNIVAKLASPVK